MKIKLAGHILLSFLFGLAVLTKAQDIKVYCTWYDKGHTKLNEIFYTEGQTACDTVSQLNPNESLGFFFLKAQNKGNRYKKYDYNGNYIIGVEIDTITKNDPRYWEKSYLKDTIWVKTEEQENELHEMWKFYSYSGGRKNIYKERLIEYDIKESGNIYARPLEIEHFEEPKSVLYKKNILDVQKLTGNIISYETVNMGEINTDYQPKILGQRSQIKGTLVGTEFIYCDVNGALVRIVEYENDGSIKTVTCFGNSFIRLEKNADLLRIPIKSVRKGRKVKIYDAKGNLIKKTKIPKMLKDHKTECYCHE